jgi:glycosyltransferase-like protein
MVEARIADTLLHFENPEHRRFDVFHAGDGITGNALATLKERGEIARFARTVHHIDFFADPSLAALQRRSIEAADEIFVVSQKWRGEVASRFERLATFVGNGVDRQRFSAAPPAGETALKTRLGLRGGPLFLSVGGVEERKNTFHILEAFVQAHKSLPAAQLVIAGGASLLDHRSYQNMFAAQLDSSGLPWDAVVVTGPLPDIDIPALYRLADALVFPSLDEGFGLVVLEAMASGTPVIVSRQPPFTEYVGEDDAIWCDPSSPDSISQGMLMALDESRRARLIVQGFAVAARNDWPSVATKHLSAYARLTEFAHA